jgi:hypothetical protein
MELAAEGQAIMRNTFLAIAIALASVFGAQQAVAKNSTRHSTKTKATAAAKKHHKTHMKKTAALSMVTPTA